MYICVRFTEWLSAVVTASDGVCVCLSVCVGVSDGEFLE